MKPRAIIFDMDDTLVATGRLWRQSETILLETIGHQWSPELAAHFKGMNAYDVAAVIHRKLSPQLSLKECQAIMRDSLFKAYEKGPLEAMQGAVDCVQRLAGRAPMAVASGSPLPLIEMALERTGLRKNIAVLLSSESVALGKPSPDVFLAAAAALKVNPADCLVFEDSLIGVQAARAAKMACIAIPSISSDEIRQIAWKTFSSFDEITDELLGQIFPKTPSST